MLKIKLSGLLIGHLGNVIGDTDELKRCLKLFHLTFSPQCDCGSNRRVPSVSLVKVRLCKGCKLVLKSGSLYCLCSCGQDPGSKALATAHLARSQLTGRAWRTGTTGIMEQKLLVENADMLPGTSGDMLWPLCGHYVFFFFYNLRNYKQCQNKLIPYPYIWVLFSRE